MEYPTSSKYAGRNHVDYVLTAPPSTSTLDWSHNLMKLQPAGQGKVIDPRQFTTPVHLSRPYSLQEREIRTRDIGDAVMMPSDKSKEEMDESLVAPADKKRIEGRKFGMKKTQRVYQTEASAIARTIAREERNPWLLEDSTRGKAHQRWVGRVEGGTASLGGVDDGGTGGTSAKKGGNYMLFVMDDQSDTPQMQVLPVHRWYKFFPKPLIKNLDAEEAEREFTKRAKAKSEDRWGVRNRRVDEARSRGEPRVKGEVKEEDSAPSRGFSAIHGERRNTRRRDEDQYDEFDFEDEFQDDEEGAGQYGDDAMDADEAKELEDRIKKNQRGAIPFGEVQPVSDDVDPDDERQLDPTGKQAKKLLKKLEKVEYASDSDDDRNPYASDVESESDEPDGTATSLKSSQTKPSLPSARKLTSLPPSRSGSPITASSVAKRATSPKASKPASRATSPTASKPSSRATSPTIGSKRQREDEEDGATKKAKVVVDESVRQALTAEVLVGFVRKAKTPKDASVKQVLKFIKSKLKVDPRAPGVMGHLDSLIRENLVLADGVLTLKE